jgi:hypothetical protein
MTNKFSNINMNFVLIGAIVILFIMVIYSLISGNKNSKNLDSLSDKYSTLNSKNNDLDTKYNYLYGKTCDESGECLNNKNIILQNQDYNSGGTMLRPIDFINLGLKNGGSVQTTYTDTNATDKGNWYLVMTYIPSESKAKIIQQMIGGWYGNNTDFTGKVRFSTDGYTEITEATGWTNWAKPGEKSTPAPA